MIPETTREALVNAIDRFDRELRDSPEWKDWEQRESHRYAIDQNGQLYPVKQIVSMATDTPVARFSGGSEANSFVEKLGFKVMGIRQLERGELSWQRLLEQILSEYLARNVASIERRHCNLPQEPC